MDAFINTMNMKVESLKFCKDCKYFNPIGAKCNAFKNFPPAIKVRPDPKKCGENAKFFRPKK